MNHPASLEVAGVLAALAVSDMEKAIEWTTRLFGRPPDARPMETLADWDFGPQGTLQLVLDPDRAGGSLVTLHVQGIAAARARLAERGITLDYDDTTSTKVKFGQLSDPDGNAITLVEPLGNSDTTA
jgi:hypothetical protein